MHHLDFKSFRTDIINESEVFGFFFKSNIIVRAFETIYMRLYLEFHYIFRSEPYSILLFYFLQNVICAGRNYRNKDLASLEIV